MTGGPLDLTELFGPQAATGEFEGCPIDRIVVNQRIRRDLGHKFTDLKSSIDKRGLLHPITVDRDYVLVTGFRRLTACRELGHPEIKVQFLDNLTPEVRRLIEIEENEVRADLSPQDLAREMDEYHEIKCRMEPGWTQAKTANARGCSQPYVAMNLLVARCAKAGNKEVLGAKTSAEAIKAAQKAERWDNAVADARLEYGRIKHLYRIECADFNEWAPTYDGPPFNLLHCDFPYGVESDDFGQGAKGVGTYEDSPEVAARLCRTLRDNLDQLIAESAHIIFWFPIEHYARTRGFIEGLGFTVEENPLVWHKLNNSGITPRPDYGPRRIYETAFFGWREARIVGVKSNLYSAPKTTTIHKHEKNAAMLQHFFEMVVRPDTALLDPACGSGAALRAARSLGAARALGLEAVEDYAVLARAALDKPVGEDINLDELGLTE